jgi:hypothetical protein
MQLHQIVDMTAYPLADPEFRASCRRDFDRQGLLVMSEFIRPEAIGLIAAQGLANRHRVFADTATHNVYLSPDDPSYAPDHPRNRRVVSSKGCITDDVIARGSALRTLYDSVQFRDFLCAVLGEEALFEYADPLSSINLHYAETGQELGWHFDNSSFSITLMVQPAAQGGQFEYVENIRDADAGEMSFDTVADILDGRLPVRQLNAEAGTLVFFRGRNSLHRVAPNDGEVTRMLAVLAYNSAPGVALSQEARMTFYGRVE